MGANSLANLGCDTCADCTSMALQDFFYATGAFAD